MPFIIPANTLASGGFEVANSVRMNRGSTDHFRRTNTTAETSNKIGTYSGWVKRSTITLDGMMFEGKDLAANNYTQIYFQATGKLTVYGSGSSDIVSTALFRDPTAWYHICVAFDTTQGTAANRVKIYVNGVQLTSLTNGNGDAADYPDQNDVIYFAVNGDQQAIGIREDGALLWNGYFSEVVYIDGAALAPTSFGEFDEDSGIWKPIKVSGLTFGNNGCYLDFKDSSSLGNVVAGRTSVDFTVTNLTAIDQTTDTCTNNFCTMNPLSSGMTLTEGNTNVAGAATAKSTFGVASGKWYVEMKATNAQTYNPIVGIATASSLNSGNPASSDHPGSFVESHGYDRSGVIKSNDNTAVQSGLTTSQSDGDIIGLAIDLDSGTKTAQWYVNGSSVGSAVTLVSNDAYVFMTYASGSQAGTGAWNFGNPSFTGTDKADGNGFGSFEYQPPSGFLALCTKNLAESG